VTVFGCGFFCARVATREGPWHCSSAHNIHLQPAATKKVYTPSAGRVFAHHHWADPHIEIWRQVDVSQGYEKYAKAKTASSHEMGLKRGGIPHSKYPSIAFLAAKKCGKSISNHEVVVFWNRMCQHSCREIAKRWSKDPGPSGCHHESAPSITGGFLHILYSSSKTDMMIKYEYECVYIFINK